MSKKSTKIQLCSTFMDMSDDNNDLNDFLGTAMKKKKNLFIIIHNTVLPVLDRSKEFQPRSFMSLWLLFYSVKWFLHSLVKQSLKIPLGLKLTDYLCQLRCLLLF